MDVAVIGSGPVGTALSTAAAAAGHQVRLGSRHTSPAPPTDPGVPTVPIGEAIDASDVVILTIPGAAVAGLAVDHASSLASKIVIDATNNIGGAGPISSVTAIAAAVPTAHVFRAFNSVGWENMTVSDPGAVRPDMFFAGPDDSTLPTVEGLIGDIGPRPVYVGADDAAHAAVDALTGLWFALAFGRGRGRRIAFKLLET